MKGEHHKQCIAGQLLGMQSSARRCANAASPAGARAVLVGMWEELDGGGQVSGEMKQGWDTIVRSHPKLCQGAARLPQI